MVRIVLLRFLESYFRHRWLYLLPLVLATVAGTVFVLTTPPTYFAGGQLYVEKDSLLASLTATRNDGSMWVTAARTTTDEITELLGSRAFTRSAIQKTDLERNMSGGPEAVERTFVFFRRALSVQPQGDKIVAFIAETEDPKLSFQIVQATMDAFVQWKMNTDFQESIAAQKFFEAQLQPYNDEVDAARNDMLNYLSDHPAPPRADRPPQEQMEIERLRGVVTRAEERLATAKANEESARLSQVKAESLTRQTYQVIDQPQMPTDTASSLKDMLKNIAIFVVAGLILTVVGISAGALLDRSLRFPIDVRHGLSLPVLAMVMPGTAAATPLPVPIAKPSLPDEQATSESAQKSDPTTLQPQL